MQVFSYVYDYRIPISTSYFGMIFFGIPEFESREFRTEIFLFRLDQKIPNIPKPRMSRSGFESPGKIPNEKSQKSHYPDIGIGIRKSVLIPKILKYQNFNSGIVAKTSNLLKLRGFCEKNQEVLIFLVSLYILLQRCRFEFLNRFDSE